MMCTNTMSAFSHDHQAANLPSAAGFIWSRTSLLKEFWDLVHVVESWSGAVIGENHNGLRFTLNGVELGQLNWGGQLVLMFGPEARKAIVAEKMAEVDSDQPDANRVVIDIASAVDLKRALCLLRLAYLVSDSDQSMPDEESDALVQLSPGNVDRPGDQVLPVIAHELRQPLSAIILALEAAHDERGGECKAHWADEIARNQARHMSRIIDDMLDTFCCTRDGTRLNLGQVDLAAMVIDAIEAARPAFASRGHRISVSLPPEPVFLVADRSRVVQVLTNLLTNAAKYTDRGGRICLTADLSTDGVAIAVRDNGRGISPELLGRIFDPYQRGPHQRESGLGLGLTLVKSLVELHGGSVVAHSQGPGMGSEFVVRLPRVARHHLEARPIPSSNTPLLA